MNITPIDMFPNFISIEVNPFKVYGEYLHDPAECWYIYFLKTITLWLGSNLNLNKIVTVFFSP